MLERAVLAEGYVKNREKQETAKVEGKCLGIKQESTLRAFYHIAHYLAYLADRADDAHYVSRSFQREFFLFAYDREPRDENGAKPDPDQMLGVKHSDVLLEVCNSLLYKL